MTGRARVVVALDSFKGSIRAREAVDAFAAGWLAARPGDDVARVPMADGGEGTLDAFEAAVPGARRMPVTVPGPAGADVAASWLLLPATAERRVTGVVELASTSGFELLDPSALRPLDADTRGFGRAIRGALDAGVDRLVLAIGSSASSDGGAGMLRELGVRVLDERGVETGDGARGLEAAATVELEGVIPLPTGGAVVLADVTAPLLGPTGAAAVFGPQKGATADDVARIDAALAHWASLLGGDPGIPGAGAAGGTGFGLLSWGARLEPGAATVAELVGLRDAIRDADLVVAGEGRFDGQSAHGKAPGLVLDAARTSGVPAAVVAGLVDAAPAGVRTVALADLAGGPAASLADPSHWLRAAGALLAREHEG